MHVGPDGETLKSVLYEQFTTKNKRRSRVRCCFSMIPLELQIRSIGKQHD